VRDRRYVQDGPIITTTGVSASIPASLALVEAIGGRDIAAATARRMGVTSWGAYHRTGDFHLTKTEIARALATVAAVWTHETVEAPIADGVDEVALALAIGEHAAGTLQASPSLSVGPESADVISVVLTPSAAAKLAVADALANRRSVDYTLKGTLAATPDEGKRRSYEIDRSSALSPAPGLPGVLR